MRDSLAPLCDELTRRGVPHRVAYPLNTLTTYRLGGPAALALLPSTSEEAARAMELLHKLGLADCAVIGGGSNVLIADGGIPGPTLLLSRLNQCSWEGTSGAPLLRLGAGVGSSTVAELALARGYAGAEFLSALPGSIGGAAFMNARAFGAEMGQLLVEARGVTREGALLRLSLRPEEFQYKSSPFRQRELIVTEVTLQLSPGTPEEINAKMEANRAHRKKNGEELYPSCGCVFKNPYHYGISAGKIIDDLDLKGFGTPNVWVHHKHANFIVHNGQATSREVRSVMEAVRAKVKAALDLELQFEVEFLGEWSP